MRFTTRIRNLYTTATRDSKNSSGSERAQLVRILVVRYSASDGRRSGEQWLISPTRNDLSRQSASNDEGDALIDLRGACSSSTSNISYFTSGGEQPFISLKGGSVIRDI